MFGTTPMHPVLPAIDLERAKRWYAEKFELEPLNVTEFGDLEYETGGGMFLVYQSEFAGSNKASTAGFKLADFDATISRLRSNGVVFEYADFGEYGATVDGVITSPDGEHKAAWFKDSEGNTFALSSGG